MADADRQGTASTVLAIRGEAGKLPAIATGLRAALVLSDLILVPFQPCAKGKRMRRASVMFGHSIKFSDCN